MTWNWKWEHVNEPSRNFTVPVTLFKHLTSRMFGVSPTTAASKCSETVPVHELDPEQSLDTEHEVGRRHGLLPGQEHLGDEVSLLREAAAAEAGHCAGQQVHQSAGQTHHVHGVGHQRAHDGVQVAVLPLGIRYFSGEFYYTLELKTMVLVLVVKSLRTHTQAAHLLAPLVLDV